MNWYAVTTKSQHEKSVADQLQAKDLETFLPLYRARHHWSDRTKIVELPLFARYVFCRFAFQDRLKVLQISSIHSIVSFGGKPEPIPDHEVDTLRTAVGSGLPVYPWPLLTSGQRVRVCGGSMEGVEGRLLRTKNCYRVVINVEILNRAVAVEIERDLIRAVAGAAAASSSELYLGR